MNTKERLTYLYHNASYSVISNDLFVVFSDPHFGDMGPADDSAENRLIFETAWNSYKLKKYKILSAADWLELWQFKKREVICNWTPDYAVSGNHDKELGNTESMILICQGQRFFIVHGNQGDFFNDRGWKIGRFFTRYVWKPLEMIGVKSWLSTSKNIKRHDLVRNALCEWANENKVTLICGHTHTQEHEGYYWNVGSGVKEGIECIEGPPLKLVRWTERGRIVV